MPATEESPRPDPEANQEQRPKVCAELWTSFVALIRSYVAAHDLAMPVANHAQVEQAGPGRLTVQGENKTLALEFEPAHGTGKWTIHEVRPGSQGAKEQVLEQGSFEIDEDSRVTLSDRLGKLELEVAAEAFTAKVFSEV